MPPAEIPAEPESDTVDALASLLRPGALVVVADGAGAPLHLLPALARAAERVGPVELVLGWCLSAPQGLDSTGFSSIRGFIGGYGAAAALATGRITYVPVRLSTLPALLRTVWRPDVFLTSAVSIDGGVKLATEAAWIPTGIEAARHVAVWHDVTLPAATRIGTIHTGNLTVVGSGHRPLAELPSAELTAVDLKLGRQVAALLPEGAAVQFGPGRVGQALMQALERPVEIWSGLLIDECVELDRRGLMTAARASYLIGTTKLFDWAAGKGFVDRVENTHIVATLAKRPFVAVNTALQIDLSGQVNVETVGSRTLGAVGGHPDFALAAASAPCGLSVVAIPSARGGASTLVETLSSPTTTARYDIDIVVTESGSADLRGRGHKERAELLTELWQRPSR